MTKKQTIKILTAKSTQGLESEINDYLDDGWLLRGLLLLNGGYYVQMIVKETKPATNDTVKRKREFGTTRSKSTRGYGDERHEA